MTAYPLRRIAFHVEYDGTGLHGWQSQPSGIPTIQQSIEEAITDIIGEPVSVVGASRTDAGVHARDQFAAVSVRHPIRPAGLCKGVNRRLAPAIALRGARDVPLDFHPRFANQGKIYRYRMYHGRAPRPLIDRYAWRLPWPVAVEPMRVAAAALIGEHDFTSFAASGGGHRHAVREVRRIDIEPGVDGTLAVVVEGRGFLKHMVRNLVGTLIDVGRRRTEPGRMAAILAARDRARAGPTAPARGLCLEKMLLDEE